MQFALIAVQVDGINYQRLFAAFTFESPYFINDPVQKVPLTRQQASGLFLRFRMVEYPYRNCCEIWWKGKRKLSDNELIEQSLTHITESYLDIPQTVKVPMFFWRKPLFVFAYN